MTSPSIPEQPLQLKRVSVTTLGQPDPSIRNLDTNQIIINLAFPVIEGESADLSKPFAVPERVKISCLDLVLNLLRETHLNYFILEQSNLLFALVEKVSLYSKLPSQSKRVLKSVMDIFHFILIDIGYVPLKVWGFADNLE